MHVLDPHIQMHLLVLVEIINVAHYKQTQRKDKVAHWKLIYVYWEQSSKKEILTPQKRNW